MSGLVIAPQGDRAGFCLNLRFQLSVSALKRLAAEQEDVPGRVILIWTGRGWPLLSAHEFRPYSAALKQNFFDNLVEVTNALREAQVTLEAVFSPDLFRTLELRSDHDNAFFCPCRRGLTWSLKWLRRSRKCSLRGLRSGRSGRPGGCTLLRG